MNKDASFARSRLVAEQGTPISQAGLRLLVLHGSRANGSAGPDSDWDFGYLGDDRVEPAELRYRITAALRTESVDLVDLARASALLRYRAARDGMPLLECPHGSFEEFQLDASLFWCDAGPVIRAAHADVLASL